MAVESSPPRPLRPNVTGLHHMVSCGHPASALAGVQMLEAGGNAIDAGIAASLATNVLQTDLTGFAGIAPSLIYLADRDEVVSVIGSGNWPRLATLEFFHKNHKGEIPLGILESIVPSAPDAYIQCLARYGTMSFAEVARPAIRMAREGFPMYGLLAQLIREKNVPWPTTRAIFFPGGRAPEAGELFVQADMARTLQFLCDEEARAAARGGRRAGLRAVWNAFYRGDIAKTIDAFYRANGGLLRYEDLANYRGGIQKPVKARFRDLDIYANNPGNLHLVEALHILDGFDLRAMGHNSAAYIHHVTEAFKLAFADREAYIADPDMVDVPTEVLCARDYADRQRKRIDPAKAAPDMPAPGDVGRRPGAKSGSAHASHPLQELRRDGGTSYVCAVDRHRNAFSSMVSGGNINGPIVSGTGLSMSHFGICGSTDPNNVNRVEPGKRMRNGGPALAVRAGKLIMPFGTPGSDVIPQAIAQVLFNMEVFGMDPQSAVEAPRFASFSFPASFFPHAYTPGELKVEESLARRSGDALTKMGHKITIWPERIWRSASVCLIRANLESGVLNGAADYRRDAYAIGW